MSGVVKNPGKFPWRKLSTTRPRRKCFTTRPAKIIDHTIPGENVLPHGQRKCFTTRLQTGETMKKLLAPGTEK